MAEATDEWEDDLELKEDLEYWVRQGLMRKEILDFVNRDYAQYKWSIPSLDRQVRYLEIYYNDQETSVEDVKRAVNEELSGPGKLLGYRAMHKKIRQEHGLKVCCVMIRIRNSLSSFEKWTNFTQSDLHDLLPTVKQNPKYLSFLKGPPKRYLYEMKA